jgi:putative nucleotidyltransferase with HDIG domain
MSDEKAEKTEKTEKAAKAAKPIKITTLWVSDASKERITNHIAVDISTSLDDLSNKIDVVLVSTRLPRVRMLPVMNKIREVGPKSVVVVCHAGGEQFAVSLLEMGAQSVIAEGNESSLALVYPDSALENRPADANGLIVANDPIDPELLLSGFRQRLAANGSNGSEVTIDPASGLPSASTLERMLNERARQARLPRLGYIELVNSASLLERVDARMVTLVSQRLSLLLDGACKSQGVQLFAGEDLSYAFLGDDLDTSEADDLAERLVSIGASFRPDGVEALQVAVGHAGPDVADNDRTLRDLAMRATSAARRRGGGVVNAGYLSTEEAIDTELNAAFTAMERLTQDEADESHGTRVAELAVELARELGYDQTDLLRIRLSALFHDIGKVTLGRQFYTVEEKDLDGEELEKWREHPKLGADYLRFSGGPDVSNAVQNHHEHWDGSGFPNGTEGEDIPLDARIILVADAVTRTLDNQGPDEATKLIEEGAGTLFDPSVADALVVLRR